VAGRRPGHQAALSDSVGLALLVVLDTLTPAERLAFVLHDVFAVPFSIIAALLERSPAAAKMLASRARHRVQGARSPTLTWPGSARWSTRSSPPPAPATSTRW
jgi:RNA polymerase sigma-70 factor (ECF subfamily)